MYKDVVLEVKNLTKIYYHLQKPLEVLKGINLILKRGEKIAIIGPSGVGKTTLLNIIGTLDKPTSGEIIYFGKNIFNKNENFITQFRREHIGFVFQLHYLMPEFSVVENTILPGLIAGWNFDKCYKRAKELLKMLNLENKFFYKPSQLSGGERQRVAIARALFLNPSLLLADEPTGNLDPKTAKNVIECFLKINKEYNTSIIIATHNIEIAKKMDKIFLLKDGFLIELKNNSKGD